MLLPQGLVPHRLYKEVVKKPQLCHHTWLLSQHKPIKRREGIKESHHRTTIGLYDLYISFLFTAKNLIFEQQIQQLSEKQWMAEGISLPTSPPCILVFFNSGGSGHPQPPVHGRSRVLRPKKATELPLLPRPFKRCYTTLNPSQIKIL